MSDTQAPNSSGTVPITLPDGRVLHMSQVGVSRAIARGIELGYLDFATGTVRKARPSDVPSLKYTPPS